MAALGANEPLLEASHWCGTTPSRIASRKERQAILDECLNRLPPDYQLVLRHYDLEGRPVSEVAGALERSPGAVFMLRARAHDRLRELLPEVSAIFSCRS